MENIIQKFRSEFNIEGYGGEVMNEDFYNIHVHDKGNIRSELVDIKKLNGNIFPLMVDEVYGYKTDKEDLSKECTYSPRSFFILGKLSITFNNALDISNEICYFYFVSECCYSGFDADGKIDIYVSNDLDSLIRWNMSEYHREICGIAI